MTRRYTMDKERDTREDAMRQRGENIDRNEIKQIRKYSKRQNTRGRRRRGRGGREEGTSV